MVMFVVSDTSGAQKTYRDVRAFLSSLNGRYYLDPANSKRVSHRSFSESLKGDMFARIYEEDSCEWKFEVRAGAQK